MSAHTNYITLSAHSALVALAVLALIYIDHETQSLADVFRWQHVPAFLLYFIPAYTLSIAIHALLENKLQRTNSFVAAVAVGVPLAFGVVIYWILSVI